jgi:hypothetical protein
MDHKISCWPNAGAEMTPTTPTKRLDGHPAKTAEKDDTDDTSGWQGMATPTKRLIGSRKTVLSQHAVILPS